MYNTLGETFQGLDKSVALSMGQRPHFYSKVAYISREDFIGNHSAFKKIINVVRTPLINNLLIR